MQSGARAIIPEIMLLHIEPRSMSLVAALLIGALFVKILSRKVNAYKRIYCYGREYA